MKTLLVILLITLIFGSQSFAVHQHGSSIQKQSDFQKVEKNTIWSKITQTFKKAKPEVETILLVILAIIIPPLAVFLKVDLTTHFWINLILCLLFWLPGIIHALWVVLTK